MECRTKSSVTLTLSVEEPLSSATKERISQEEKESVLFTLDNLGVKEKKIRKDSGLVVKLKTEKLLHARKEEIVLLLFGQMKSLRNISLIVLLRQLTSNILMLCRKKDLLVISSFSVASVEFLEILHLTSLLTLEDQMLNLQWKSKEQWIIQIDTV